MATIHPNKIKKPLTLLRPLAILSSTVTAAQV